jgi:hypothetical protein
MPKEGNIYDLVERAAARRGVPRLELWEEALRALTEKRLKPLNLDLSEPPNLRASPNITYGGWLSDILRATVDRRFDPARVRYLFGTIRVRLSDFESWLRKASIGSRGPRPNTTGYRDSDRRLFPRMRQLIKSGEARSAHGAAKILAEELKGKGTVDNKAKRVSEHPNSR